MQKLFLKRLVLKENREWPGDVMVLGSFQSRGVLLIWIIVWHELSVLSAGTLGDCLGRFSLTYRFPFSFSLSLGDSPIETEIRLKGPLNLKQSTN